MEINFKNDVLFKYALSNEKDKDCQFLLKLIIDEVIGINYQSLHVINPDIIPERLLDKDIILDILIEDNQGRKIDIEMQKSSLSLYLYQRFQYYGAKLLSTQLDESEPYDRLHAVYQIIFIDDINKDNPCLKEVYTSRTDKALQEKNNLIHRIYIFLPYINEIRKEKTYEEMSSLEKLIYIFANGIDDDIMDIEEEVIKVMKKKLETFKQDKELAHYAMQRQLGRWVVEGEKRLKYEEG
ncbi:MAG: Rpn family recombination-promoting nuclease/putative transposase, partial [Coprobacillus sp.]